MDTFWHTRIEPGREDYNTSNSTSAHLQAIYYDSSTTFLQPPRLHIFFVVLEITIASMGTFLNVGLVVSVLMSRQLRNSNTSIFIISLCCSDFIVCAFVMPINTFSNNGILIFKNDSFSTTLCKVIACINVSGVTSSSFVVTAIAIDRYMCINDPFLYYLRVSRPKLIVAVCCLWMASIFLAIIPFAVSSNSQFNPDEVYGRCLIEESTIYKIITIVITIFLPCIIITTVYSMIFGTAYSHFRASLIAKVQLQQQQQQDEEDGATLSQAPTSSQNVNSTAKPIDVGQGSSAVEDKKSPSPSPPLTVPESVFSGLRSTLSTSATPTFPGSVYGGLRSTREETNATISTDVPPWRERVRESLKSTFISKVGTSNYKATVTLTIIVGVFLLHWVPFGVVNMVEVVSPELVSYGLRRVCMWLVILNSCWNPLIYSMSNSMYRQDIRRTLDNYCHCCKICVQRQSFTWELPSDIHKHMRRSSSHMFHGLGTSPTTPSSPTL